MICIRSEKITWVDLHKRMTSWSQLCHKRLLLQSHLKVIHYNCSSACRTFCCFLAEDTDCHALRRVDHANIRTVTIRTTDFFQKNRKMKMIRLDVSLCATLLWHVLCFSWLVHAPFWSVIRLISMSAVQQQTAKCGFLLFHFFTMPLHVLQRTVLPRSFCPSVGLSLCQTRGFWPDERKLCPHSYTIWKVIHTSFLTRRMVGGGNPFYLKFWAKLTPLNENVACSTSAITPTLQP